LETIPLGEYIFFFKFFIFLSNFTLQLAF
jgi:hypothetical protein